MNLGLFAYLRRVLGLTLPSDICLCSRLLASIISKVGTSFADKTRSWDCFEIRIWSWGLIMEDAQKDIVIITSTRVFFCLCHFVVEPAHILTHSCTYWFEILLKWKVRKWQVRPTAVLFLTTSWSFLKGSWTDKRFWRMCWQILHIYSLGQQEKVEQMYAVFPFHWNTDTNIDRYR